MRAPSEKRDAEEAASSDRAIDRWLAVSEPLAVDDDPDWEESARELWLSGPAA